ncbi:L-aspartate oxidase [Sodalis sp. CWE]|uniref:L-aspartate oxidase n=1 Tax=Sodalis sp. CWE TaxID=2803816 RepID=UPI001C7D523C|nr:L-aspartate oxidase [Sodalis sp. CWE]MBX4181029.1 L-aspartate oxidase [Sodalis sp. CWE]
MKSLKEHTTDVLIIGSGAAGLSLALRLSDNLNITILSKSSINEGSTLYAQGGIAAVFNKSDSISSHINDTLKAGVGICDPEIVEFVVSNASHCIKWLENQGVSFDTEESLDSNIAHYRLAREGGHSYRRILHVSDATGMAIETALVKKLSTHPRVKVLEYCQAIDLIISNHVRWSGSKRVLGAYIWNRAKEEVELYQSNTIVLATGGASKVYQYTTNPEISSGDGIAMAWRAGCRVANLEFNQFHPTCLFHPKEHNFLLTEALRGEGAYLCRSDGSRFMTKFDVRAELAPRDIVTRGIDCEMKRLGMDCMYLDLTHWSKNFLSQRFPTIYNKLLTVNIDPTCQFIPIVPAAHYTCGGIVVDKHGKTDLEGLYAIGEVSYTGLHGANRLASNSLLECLVYSWSAAENISHHISTTSKVCQIPPWNINWFNDPDEKLILRNIEHELRSFMWNYVGIIRTKKRLERAQHRIELLHNEISRYYSDFRFSKHLLEVRNLIQVSELIIKSALQRKESRGLHFILDYPNMEVDTFPTILEP